MILEYQKIINFLDNTPNQLTKSRIKYQVEINDVEHGTYITNSQIKFRTSMLRSSLCDYRDAYILIKGTITVEAQAGDNSNNANKKVICKN